MMTCCTFVYSVINLTWFKQYAFLIIWQPNVCTQSLILVLEQLFYIFQGVCYIFYKGDSLSCIFELFNHTFPFLPVILPICPSLLLALFELCMKLFTLSHLCINYMSPALTSHYWIKLACVHSNPIAWKLK